MFFKIRNNINRQKEICILIIYYMEITQWKSQNVVAVLFIWIIDGKILLLDIPGYIYA